MGKKNIVFVIPSLGAGGAEKSLIELLNQFDFEKYNVDLLVFNLRGMFKKQLNKNINIIELNKDERIITENAKCFISYYLKKRKFLIIIKRIVISVIYKIFNKYINDNCLVWNNFKNKYTIQEKEYDVAISYLQGISAYYTIDKIKANKKILWMHTDYGKSSKKSKYDIMYNEQFNEVVTVSKSAQDDFIKYHPIMKNNTHLIYNIINIDNILKLANEKNEIDKDKFNIISVGRLHYAKGFDIVIPVISRLIKDDIDINWYIVGEGPERNKLERLIKQYNLQQNCILLGEKENPYSYINSADIYLQSSRYEGYCITLAEARALSKPIISTDFFGAREQLTHMHTGLIVKCDNESIYLGLKKLIQDKKLRNLFINNLLNFNYDNEIEKISSVYKIIG